MLHINGTERAALCDPNVDSLADVIRRFGLTGTKVGCEAGQCGSCSVLLNGELVRACIKKMRTVPNYSKVETIEGLGSAERLHPLQLAFMTHASVQCGFCSPGFIMSAKALLQKNPSPKRQEVRDWFTKNNNVCRCTGYKPIVDAVMAAAEVLRGEKTMQDISYTMPEDGRLYGSKYPKPTALGKVLGTCDFGHDVAMKMPPGSLHLAVVMAQVHHARIKNLDFSAAETMPGVVKIITAKDIQGSNRIFSPLASVRGYCDGYDRPVICDEKVFRYGDVVAVVAAASREQARAAATQVKVDYELLPAYLNYMEAVAPGALEIHEGVPNVYLEQPLIKGEETAPILDQAKYVAQGSFSSTRQPHLTIEPEVAQAYPQDGGVVIHCKSQFLFGNIACMAAAIGLPKEKIRMILNPAGASFGYSMSPSTYALTAACALAVNAPVSLVFSYPEHQHYTGKRSPAYINARLACDENGKFTAMDYHVGVDHGAYSDLAAALTSKVCRFFGCPYSVPHIRGLVQTAFTNHNFGIAYRSFGSPQAYTASEQLIDMLAEKINMDPFELRYRNVAREGDLCTNSVPYREYPMESMMDTMRPYYEAAVKKAKEHGTASKKRGVGLAWGGYQVGKSPDHSEVDLELNPDGTVTHYSCWADVGQGADTGALTHAHEALRPLKLLPEQIKLVRNDTKTCPDTGSASGSRSHHVAGLATIDAAAQLLKAMRKTDGSYRSWQEMHDEGIPTRYRGVYDSKWPDLHPDTGHGYGCIAQNYCLFLAEVELDINTGKTVVLAATVVPDVGKVGNYMAVLGQVWGGFSHSVGFALSENYDDVKKHATLAGAGVPKCNDVPDDFTVVFHESYREDGPYGSTGCAEAFQSAGHVAIINAISNAAGVRIYSLPATPEKVKAALEAKEKKVSAHPLPWQLGCELYERLAYLKANPVKK